jgi:hypothetical protein
MIHVIYTEPSPFGAMLTDRQFRSPDAARRFVATIADGDVPYLVIDGELVNEEWTSHAGGPLGRDLETRGRAERAEELYGAETLRDDDDRAEHDAEAAYDAVMRDHR